MLAFAKITAAFTCELKHIEHTSIEYMNIHRASGLIVFPSAITAEGEDVLPDSHSRMVDPPWPPLKVNRPPLHFGSLHFTEIKCHEYLR